MDALALVRRLPPAVALELLEVTGRDDVASIALALELSPDEAAFQRWCDRLSLAPPLPSPDLVRVARHLGPSRALALAEADRERGAVGRAAAELALHRAALRAARGETKLALTALEDALVLDASVAPRVALERLALGEPAGLPLPEPSGARDRWLVLRDRLRSARSAGRYVRAQILEELLELARDAPPPIPRACLRTAVEHLDALGSAATAIELDRVRVLRDRAVPGLALGPPLEPEGPSELGARAEAAVRGQVRGALPEPSDPHHADALAIETVAHLVRGSEAALGHLRALSALEKLPRSSWAVLEQCRGRALRRASARLAVRAARELTPPEGPLVPLALAHEGQARRALLVAALLVHEEAAGDHLRAEIEADALALRERGARAAALAMLEHLEAALGGDVRAARALAES